MSLPAAAPIRVRGRVLLVQPLKDGQFGVTVGPGPHVYWYSTWEPPRLGQRVELGGLVTVQSQLGKGTISVLQDVDLEVLGGSYATRVVAPHWVARVRGAMARPLYAYQENGAAWMAQRLAAGRGAMLSDDPGCGKTPQTIAAICATGMFPALIVCPNNIKRNWAREFGWATDPPSVEILQGKQGRLPLADVIIVNYELLSGRERQLASLGCSVVVFDEGQLLKDSKPGPHHRAAVATRLAHWIGRVLLLTGTPIMNDAEELWRLLHLVDPKEWDDFQEYAERYCRQLSNDEAAAMPRPARNLVTKFGRVERLDELHARVQTLMLRRQRSEILVDLPKKSRRSVLIQLEPKDMKAYREVEKDVVLWLRQQGRDASARAASRAIAIRKLTLLRHIAAVGADPMRDPGGKMRRAVPEYLAKWFDRAELEPLLVFAFHTDALELLRNESRRLGIRLATIRSHDDPLTRERAVDAFNGGYADIFVAPIESAGVGLNLHIRCCNALFIERLWTPARLIQAEGRLERIGQMRPVTITYLDAADTVDEHLAAVLDGKQVLIKRVVDDQEADKEGFAIVDAVTERLAS
jgi:SNF2 family DNA or RNA helicase